MIFSGTITADIITDVCSNIAYALNARMVESVDTEDLKSSGIAPCGFESRSEHQSILSKAIAMSIAT